MSFLNYNYTNDLTKISLTVFLVNLLLAASKSLIDCNKSEDSSAKDKELIKFQKAFKKHINKRKKNSLEELSVLLLPINISNFHWISMKIDLVKKEILVFDSLKSCSTGIKEISEALQIGLGYYIESNNIQTESQEWKYQLIEVDQQKNSYDCGVMALKFMEAIMMGDEVTSIRARNAEYYRYQIGLRLLNRLKKN